MCYIRKPLSSAASALGAQKLTMTTALKTRLLTEAIGGSRRCMLYFKLHTKAPMYGFPVRDDSMLAKGFIRFVPEGQLMRLRNGAPMEMVSKLIFIESLTMVTVSKNPCVDDIECAHEKQRRDSANAQK